MLKKILQDIKSSIVFIGKIENGKPVVVGTGFLLQVDGINHLVTAKHVIEKELNILGVFNNTKQLSNMNYNSFQQIYNEGMSWIRHKNSNIDIAIIPFKSDINDNIVFIPSDMLLDNLDEIVELSDIFYGSFQPNINDLSRDNSVNPIYRKGFISRINNDGTFYIDSSAFPGNSGSPIFSYPNAIEFTNQGVSIGNTKPIKLLGVMSSYVPYQDIAISAQTQRVRVIFEENTGISLVFSSQFIKEIIKQDDFQNQLNRLKQIVSLQQAKI